MKKIAFLGGVALSLVAGTASADVYGFKGSDTLFGLLTDAINLAGLSGEIQYLGGGTGLGETGLIEGTQGIAGMSRAPTAKAIEAAAAKGITLTAHVVGLDGVSIFVKADAGASQIDVATIKSIFGGVDGSGSEAACADPARVTRWEQIAGSTQTGPLRILRRNDDSGTTDAFKSLTGVKGFCADVLPQAGTADIAVETSTDVTAIAFAGLSGFRPGANKELAVAKSPEGPFVLPSETTIRTFAYPLARRLYVTEAGGAVTPNAAEQALLVNVLDRNFLDPILTANEFITCLPEGCP